MSVKVNFVQTSQNGQKKKSCQYFTAYAVTWFLIVVNISMQYNIIVYQ